MQIILLIGPEIEFIEPDPQPEPEPELEPELESEPLLILDPCAHSLFSPIIKKDNKWLYPKKNKSKLGKAPGSSVIKIQKDSNEPKASHLYIFYPHNVNSKSISMTNHNSQINSVSNSNLSSHFNKVMNSSFQPTPIRHKFNVQNNSINKNMHSNILINGVNRLSSDKTFSSNSNIVVNTIPPRSTAYVALPNSSQSLLQIQSGPVYSPVQTSLQSISVQTPLYTYQGPLSNPSLPTSSHNPIGTNIVPPIHLQPDVYPIVPVQPPRHLFQNRNKDSMISSHALQSGPNLVPGSIISGALPAPLKDVSTPLFFAPTQSDATTSQMPILTDVSCVSSVSGSIHPHSQNINHSSVPLLSNTNSILHGVNQHNFSRIDTNIEVLGQTAPNQGPPPLKLGNIYTEKPPGTILNNSSLPQPPQLKKMKSTLPQQAQPSLSSQPPANCEIEDMQNFDWNSDVIPINIVKCECFCFI